jgi:hypothetical protein
MKNTQRDWKFLAKQTRNLTDRTNLVYIGKGDASCALVNIFCSGRNLLHAQYGDGVWDNDWAGSMEHKDYFTTISNWEEVTGLNFNKINYGYIVKNSPELYVLVKKILKDKNYSQNFMGSFASWIIFDGEEVLTANLYELREEVSISEFIKKIEELPDKPKILEFSVDGRIVTINAGCITIGNNISVSVKGFKDLYYNYTTAVRPFIGNMSISFGKNGFSIYNDSEFQELLEYYSWDQWNAIRNKLYELKVIS